MTLVVSLPFFKGIESLLDFLLDKHCFAPVKGESVRVNRSSRSMGHLRIEYPYAPSQPAGRIEYERTYDDRPVQ